MTVSNTVNNSMSDEDLMLSFQQGNTLAFDILYSRYKGKVYSFVSGRMHNRTDTSEVFQQVFLKLHQSRMSFNQEYKFTQWLFTICRTSIVDFYRSKKNVSHEQWDEDHLSSRDDITQMESTEYCQEVLSRELTPAMQEAVALRVFNEDSYKEIALKLNIPEQNVRQMVSRSLKKLRMAFSGGKGEV